MLQTCLRALADAEVIALMENLAGAEKPGRRPVKNSIPSLKIPASLPIY
jgi:hypothetical protein